MTYIQFENINVRFGKEDDCRGRSLYLSSFHLDSDRVGTNKYPHPVRSSLDWLPLIAL